MIIATQIEFWGNGYRREVWIGILDYLFAHPGVRLYPGDTQSLPLADVPAVVDGVVGALLDGHSTEMPAVDVFLSRDWTNPRVGSDNRMVARMAFEHFRSLGLRNLAVLDIPHLHDVRCEPFVEACHEQGFLPHVIAADHFGDWPNYRIPAECRDAWVRQLRSLPKPAGLFLSQDAAYPPILALCKELHIRVPEDLAVLGVNNNIDYCFNFEPNLSSIELGAERIGYAAMENLVAKINGESVPDETLIPPREVIARESSNFVVDEHPTVTKVLDYIHANLAEPLETDDLLARQTLQRRAFEAHFRNACGTSPKQYIIGVRLEKARHLLETTDLYVSEIGQRCGMPSDHHLCHMFRRKYGTTPQVYRDGFRGQAKGNTGD